MFVFSSCCYGLYEHSKLLSDLLIGHVNADIEQLSGSRQIVQNVLDLSFIAQPI
jgi:hypothetical protein